MNAVELESILRNAQKEVRENLKSVIHKCESSSELQKLADLAHEVDYHHEMGKLLAVKAAEFNMDELYVGEYDVDGLYLKINEVDEQDDYYGFSEVDVGEWVSSSY